MALPTPYWNLIKDAHIPYPKPIKTISAPNVYLKWSEKDKYNYYGVLIGRVTKHLCTVYSCNRITRTDRHICGQCAVEKKSAPVPIPKARGQTRRFTNPLFPAKYLYKRPDPIVLKLAAPEVHWTDIYSLNDNRMKDLADLVFDDWIKNDTLWH
jgi:hypothetical protein